MLLKMVPPSLSIIALVEIVVMLLLIAVFVLKSTVLGMSLWLVPLGITKRNLLLR